MTLGPAGSAGIERAAPWRCDRRTRRFTVTVTAGDGTAQSAAGALRTPTCAGRLAVALRPTRPRARRPATVQVSDRWRLGAVAARVCTAQPGGVRRRCRSVRLAAGQVRAAFRFHPSRPGRYPVTVQGPAGRLVHRVLIVRPSTRRLRVLATGDSMIQIIDGDLQRRLGDRGPVSVRSDAHISTGISKPFMFDWIAHARGSARTLHPDVTVMFLGANDGFPMGTRSGRKAPCCGGEWVREYAPPRAHDDARLRPPRGGHRLLAAAPRAARQELPDRLRAGQPRPAGRRAVLPGRRAPRRPRRHLHPGREVPPDHSLAGAHGVGASGRTACTCRWRGRRSPRR